MAIGLFRRPYTIRRSGEQRFVNGYAVSSKTEQTIRLNIQPLSSDELLALPEGERSIRRIKTFGADALTPADEHTQTPGDLLLFDGKWYECKSCVRWLHTPLAHYEAEFVIAADQSSIKPIQAGGDANDA